MTHPVTPSSIRRGIGPAAALLCLAGCTPGQTSANASPSKTTFSAVAKRQAALAQKATRAIFAGGCFWGMEHYFEKEPGVLAVTAGFAGGSDSATYAQVSAGETDHAEVVEVLYDAEKTQYEVLARLFFEIHDPTQKDRQGPDVGRQYRSAVFLDHSAQKKTALALIKRLQGKGLKVVTELLPAGRFFPAADYHQDYYARTGGTPYCHVRTKRF